MEVVWWRGKVVPDNRRLIWGKQKRMVANPKYKAFKEALAWEIKAACKKKYEQISLYVSFALKSRVDKQNLLKPICDAIELSGIIKNDRQIGKITLMPAISREKDDEIFIAIRGEER